MTIRVPNSVCEEQISLAQSKIPFPVFMENIGPNLVQKGDMYLLKMDRSFFKCTQNS